MSCPFCQPVLRIDQVILQNAGCYFIQQTEPILIGSGLIIPRRHLESPFELSQAEWLDTRTLLQLVKAWMEDRYAPDGYNIGWNCGSDSRAGSDCTRTCT